jgi:hypothetical protein
MPMVGKTILTAQMCLHMHQDGEPAFGQQHPWLVTPRPVASSPWPPRASTSWPHTNGLTSRPTYDLMPATPCSVLAHSGSQPPWLWWLTAFLHNMEDLSKIPTKDNSFPNKWQVWPPHYIL